MRNWDKMDWGFFGTLCSFAIIAIMIVLLCIAVVKNWNSAGCRCKDRFFDELTEIRKIVEEDKRCVLYEYNEKTNSWYRKRESSKEK